MFEMNLDIGRWMGWTSMIKQQGSRLTEYLKAAALVFGFQDIVKHFADEAGPEGPWQQRSNRTQLAYSMLNKKHKKFNPSNKLLQLSGDLRKSIMPGTGSVTILGQKSIKLKSSLGKNYARTHDLGNRSKNIPQREFMWLSDECQNNMLDFIMTKLVN